MALSKKPTTAAAETAVAEKPAAAPAFESQEDDTPADQPSEAEVTKAQEVATTAVAVARSTAVAAPGKLTNNTALNALKDVIGQDALEQLGIGVFPRITIGLDGFSIDKTKELGRKIKIEVLSWNHIKLITTGEENDAEANKLVKTSYDGVHLKGGGLVEEYIKELKADGYDKASAKAYIEVYCHLLESEKLGVVDIEDQKIHQLSLSPQSAGKFQAYLLEAGVRKARGIADSAVVYVTQESKVVNNKKFGVGVFSAR